MAEDEDEYEKAVDRILSRFGGSYSQPSGWMENGLSFSCGPKPIYVPHAASLESMQRLTVVERLELQASKMQA